MDLGPHQSRAAHAISTWIEPSWRRRRAPERRAAAWAATAASLACYLFAFLALGDRAGSGVGALYALPAVVAGWAFGASGGLLVGLLSIPLHAAIYSSGVATPGPDEGLRSLFASFSAVAVAVSVGTARDLRERLRERSAELAESEERYRQLVDNSPEGVLVHDRGVILFANPSMARLAGAEEAKSLVGRTVVTLAPFEDRDALATSFLFAAVDQRRSRSVEARLARPDGAVVDVVMTTMPIHYRARRASLVLVREASLVHAAAPLGAASHRAPVTA